MLALSYNPFLPLAYPSRALCFCRSQASMFSALTKNGRRIVELLFFSELIADSILLKHSKSALSSGSIGTASLQGKCSSPGVAH